MSRFNYELDVANEFIAAALGQGLRAFVSHSGTYGLITDADGERVVSWTVNFYQVRLSGNYRTSAPHLTGTGWEIGTWKAGSDLRQTLATEAPGWALRGAVCRITTLAEHLAQYQQSSKYTEITEEVAAAAMGVGA